MYKIHVIGVLGDYFTSEQKELLKQTNVIFGAKRLTDKLLQIDLAIFPITPLKETIPLIKEFVSKGDVAILASGDPLFFGIGKTLLQKFDPKILSFYPSLSALQCACSLLKISWDDAKIVSLHGRKHPHLPTLLLQQQKTIVFTDRTNNPATIATSLADYLQLIGETSLLKTIKISVAEDLGLSSQRIYSGTLLDAADQQFSDLNITCIQFPDRKNNDSLGTVSDFSFGLPEPEIHHSRGLITKDEVRATTLHKLRCPRSGIMWDVGAGSGSISIEAARSNKDLTVFAIEHKPEEIANIKQNIVQFGCYNVVPVFGRAPEILEDLPSPDRIFIGGSSGSLEEIIVLAAQKLPFNGRLVVNGVIEKTITNAPLLMRKHGFSVTTSEVRITRTKDNGSIQEFNPITIMTGTIKSYASR